MPRKSKSVPDGKFKWKYDSYSNANIISVWDMNFPIRNEINFQKQKYTIYPRRHRVPLKNLDTTIEQLITGLMKLPKNKKKSICSAILKRSLEWLPETSKESFGIFLKSEYLSQEELNIIKENKLTRVKYGPFIILSRGEKNWKYYKQALEFFYRFKYLVLAEDAGIQTPYLLYQVPTDSAANFTYLLFSFLDTGGANIKEAIDKGTGMLIKSLADPEYGGVVDREIEVILLGNFLKADVPQNAVILKGGEDQIIDQFGDKAPVFIENLTTGCKPLNNATDYDIHKVAHDNAEILGRMLVFDTCAGSWDRHLGNYLIHKIDDGTLSVQEIDFGLFDPLWIKPGNYSGRLDDWVNSRYASFQGDDRPGWDITRHPRVTRMIQLAHPERVKAGIQQAMFQLELGKRTQWFSSNLSDKFVKRIETFLDMNSELRFGFQMDLAYLGLHD